MDDLARADEYCFAGGGGLVAERELQPATQNAGHLFIDVRVGWYEAALLKRDVRNHRLLADDAAALE